MAVIYNPKIQPRYLPNRSSGDSAFINKMTAGAVTPVAQGTGINPSTLVAGDAIMGGTFVRYDPVQGIRVRFDGKEITIPNSLDERIYAHFNADGSVNVEDAMATGATNWQDYRALGVTGKEYQDALKSVQEKNKATSDRQAELLAPYIKNGSLDIVKAVESGITDLKDYSGWNVNEKDISEAKEIVKKNETIASLDKYKTSDNSYDVAKAVKDGVSKDLLQDVFAINDKDYRNYELRNIYVASDGETLDVDKILKDVNGSSKSNVSGVENDALINHELAKELNEAFGLGLVKEYGNYDFPKEAAERVQARGLPEGITQADYNNAKKQWSELNTLRNELREAGDTTQAKIVTNQMSALNDFIVYVERYRNAYDRYDMDAVTIPDKEYMESMFAYGDKTIAPTIAPYTAKDGSIDLMAAIKGGVSDKVLQTVGFAPEGIAYYKDYNSALTSLAAVGAYDEKEGTIDLQAAIKGGIKDDVLETVGWDIDSIEQTREYVKAIDTITKAGAYNEETDALDIAKAVSQLDVTQAALEHLGITTEQIEQAKEYNEWIKEVETALPEIYKIKETQGDEAFFKALDDYNDKIAKSVEQLKPYTNAEGNIDIVAAMKDGIKEDTLISLGITQSTIDTVKNFNQAQETLAKYDGDLARALNSGKKEEILLVYGQDGFEYAKAVNEMISTVGDSAIKNANTLPEKDAASTAYSNYMLGKISSTDYVDLVAYLDKMNNSKEAIATASLVYGKEAVDDALNYINATNTLKKYDTDKGMYIVQYVRDNSNDISRVEQTLKAAGYDDKTIKETIDTAQKYPTPDYYEFVALRASQNIANNLYSELSDNELARALLVTRATSRDKLVEMYANEQAQKEYTDTYGKANYYGSMAAMMLPLAGFSAARALSPAVNPSDIRALEWAVTGASAVLWAIPALPKVGGAIGGTAGGILASKGLQAGISAAAGGIFIADQATHWNKMSTGEKIFSVAMDALIMLPAIGYATSKVPKVKVQKVQLLNDKGIPLKGADGKPIEVWRGLAVNDKPIIGKFNKEFTLKNGQKVTLDSNILVGYEPRLKLETNIMTSPELLKSLGFSNNEIKKLQSTIKATKSFAGKESPHLSKTAKAPATKTLSEKGVATVFEEAAKNKKLSKVYGSSTMKEQLAQDLRGWRELGDIDVQMKMSKSEAEKFAADLVKKLQKIEGQENIRISERRSTLIERKGTDGTWHHAVDIHTDTEVLEEVVKTLMSQGASKEEALKLAGSVSKYQEGAYGFTFRESPVTIEYEGIGKLKMMTLSESGKRKMASILEWRANDAGQLSVSPPAHRVKDIVDYYVVLRSFKGQTIADEWAKVYGYSGKELLEAASKSPTKEVGWTFEPATTTAKSTTSPPKLTLNQPKGLTPAKGVSPALVNYVNKAVTSPSLLISATPQQIAKMLESASPSASVSLPQASYATKPSFAASSSFNASKATLPASLNIRSSVPNSKSISVAASTPASIPASKAAGLIKASSLAASLSSLSAVASPNTAYSISAASKPSSKASSTVSRSSVPASKYANTSKAASIAASAPASAPASKAAGSIPASSPAIGSPRLSPPSSPATGSPRLSPPSSPAMGSPPSSPPYSPPHGSPHTKNPPSKPPYRRKYDDDDDKKKKYPKGTVAWKQGFIWIIKLPPMKQGDQMETIYSRYAPQDAKVRKGSPDETFFIRGGVPPAHIKHEMGVVNVDIMPKSRDSLLFTPNVKITSSGKVKIGRRRGF